MVQSLQSRFFFSVLMYSLFSVFNLFVSFLFLNVFSFLLATIERKNLSRSKQMFSFSFCCHKERPNEQIDKRTNEQTNRRTDERMNERTNERTNERKDIFYVQDSAKMAVTTKWTFFFIITNLLSKKRSLMYQS